MNLANSYDTLGRKVGKTALKDNSLKDNKFTSNNENYNLKKNLLLQSKIDSNFIKKIKFLTLEELIALKLIISTESLSGKLFNFPFLKYSVDICKESVVKFALSISKNKRDASLILGLKKADLIHYIKQYNLEEEFNYDNRRKNN